MWPLTFGPIWLKFDFAVYIRVLHCILNKFDTKHGMFWYIFQMTPGWPEIMAAILEMTS